ncbi:FAD-dependent oxidoreductase [Paenibacillus antri]|uniref:FAD-dependent oxidoreductase n=1 Tax=Paenibacillus antri TaxID=2582848 RepID=UPI00130540DD|nr:FAD-dependent oxidoreductase [Paenibacillus antri]
MGNQPLDIGANDSADAYDAVVFGGGIGGTAAAYVLAREGLRVLLCETTGTLGREIVRGRNQFADLPRYSEASSAVREFFRYLTLRGGWFDGEMDPAAAAVAFDSMMEQVGADVLFQVWPSKVCAEDGRITGAVLATKTGYRSIRTTKVVDATGHGKLARSRFEGIPNPDARTVLHVLFNGSEGDCETERSWTADGLGVIRASCRATYWPGERRISLCVDKFVSRSEWMLRLPSVVPELKRLFPSLSGSAFTYVGDDVWQTPCLRYRTGSVDARAAGQVEDAEGRPYDIRRNMLGDPLRLQGFAMAGYWLEGMPFDPAQEERALMNAFRLGELAGRSLLAD